MASEDLAIRDRRQWLEDTDMDFHAATPPQHTQRVGDAAFATVPPDMVDMLAVIDGHRLDADPLGRRRDGVKQCGAERKERTAVASRALGENRQRLVVVESVSDTADLAVRVASFRPLDVKCAVLVSEPADQHCFLDLSLGNKGRPRRPAKDQDVEPTGVIGYDQSARAERFARQAKACASDPRSRRKKSLGPR